MKPMPDMSKGEASLRLLVAVVNGRTFDESGVQDTPDTRDLWTKIQSEVDAIPQGKIVGIPFDHNLMPDEDGIAKAYNPDQPRDDHGRWGSGGGGHVDVGGERIPVITASEARGNSRPVSREEFAQVATDGKAILDRMRANASPPSGLTDNLESIKSSTYDEVQKSWGGATIDSHTGQSLASDADKYAVTVKPAGTDSVSIHENPTREEWSAAVDKAVDRFGGVLGNESHHLGVFHDDDLHRIDLDPVVVVSSRAESEAIGAYTHNIGGAYNFADGNGYWPPHVAETTRVRKMADEDVKTHFDSVAQWYAQAKRLSEQCEHQTDTTE